MEDDERPQVGQPLTQFVLLKRGGGKVLGATVEIPNDSHVVRNKLETEDAERKRLEELKALTLALDNHERMKEQNSNYPLMLGSGNGPSNKLPVTNPNKFDLSNDELNLSIQLNPKKLKKQNGEGPRR